MEYAFRKIEATQSTKDAFKNVRGRQRGENITKHLGVREIVKSIQNEFYPDHIPARRAEAKLSTGLSLVRNAVMSN